MFKIEKKAIDFFKKNYLLIFFVLITILASLVRCFIMDYESGDYILSLKVWFDYLKSNGGIKGLVNYPGDYNAPYMTIMALFTYLPLNSLYSIKMLSIIFDFVLAISSGYLVYYLSKDNIKYISGIITYGLVLILPQVILNSSMWGQCDSIYSSFTIISLIFLLKEKYLKSFLFLGLSFAFKLQFIFILPLYVILYISKCKFSILHFLIIPLTDFVLCLPAIIFGGMPIEKCITILFKQVGEYSESLVLNYPNIYQFISSNANILRKIGVLMTIIVCLFLLIYILYKKVKWNNEKVMTLALLILVLVTYILPGMHERYMYVGEILSIIYFIVYRKNLLLVIIININSFITYNRILNNLNTNLLPLISLIYGIIIIYFLKYSLNFLVNKKKKSKYKYLKL